MPFPRSFSTTPIFSEAKSIVTPSTFICFNAFTCSFKSRLTPTKEFYKSGEALSDLVELGFELLLFVEEEEPPPLQAVKAKPKVVTNNNFFICIFFYRKYSIILSYL